MLHLVVGARARARGAAAQHSVPVTDRVVGVPRDSYTVVRCFVVTRRAPGLPMTVRRYDFHCFTTATVFALLRSAAQVRPPNSKSMRGPRARRTCGRRLAPWNSAEGERCPREWLLSFTARLIVQSSGGCQGRGAAPAVSVTGTSLFFGNDLLVFEFDLATNGLVNVTACDPISGAYQGFTKPSPPPAPVKARSAVPLWQLSLSALCTPPNASDIQAGLRLDGLSAPTLRRGHGIATEAGGYTTLTLVWVGASVQTAQKQSILVDVNVTIRMQTESSSAELGTFVSKRGVGGFCVQTLALPNLEWTILRDRRDKLFVPHYFGHIGDLNDNDGVCYQGSCDLELTNAKATSDIASGDLNLMPQGNERSMQFGAMWTENTAGGTNVPLGLYLGAHDDLGRLQLLTATGQYEGSKSSPAGYRSPGNAGLRYYHLADNLIDTSAGANWRLAYPVVLASFVGDWFDAAMLHRSWALRNASWTTQGNLSVRAARESGYPHWLLETPLWANCVGYGAQTATTVQCRTM